MVHEFKLLTITPFFTVTMDTFIMVSLMYVCKSKHFDFYFYLIYLPLFSPKLVQIINYFEESL